MTTAVLAAMLALPSGVAAETSVTYGVGGVEVYATSTRGVFTGAAWAADDYGTWYAVVDHTTFDTDRNATITGGSFALDAARRDVSGAFTAGSVTLVSAAPGCGREVFDVIGTLQFDGGGHGAITAQLIHYRTTIFGRCVTYGATVSGSVNLQLGSPCTGPILDHCIAPRPTTGE